MSVLEAPFRLPEAPPANDLVAKYFRGLAIPTRVRILELLATGASSPSRAGRAAREPQPKVSNHLACLRWCGSSRRGASTAPSTTGSPTSGS